MASGESNLSVVPIQGDPPWWQFLLWKLTAWFYFGKRLSREAFGPHFYLDLIRLARKGWTIGFRVLYLVILFLGIVVMHFTAKPIPIRQLSQIAEQAQVYAHVLVVLQDLAILLMLPIYMATAIAEEREGGTLEAMFLSMLGNREIVFGKFLGRLAHLSVLVIATTPLLTFMHLWGNIDIWFLVYRQLYAVMLVVSAGSICLAVSSSSRTSFEGIMQSYPWLIGFALFGELIVGVVPWIPSIAIPTWGAWYLATLVLLTAPATIITSFCLYESQFRLEALRRSEDKRPQRTSTTMMLKDETPWAPLPRVIVPVEVSGWEVWEPDQESDQVTVVAPMARNRYRHPDDEKVPTIAGSKIHPLALPIPNDALFWKECLKDGTNLSLTWRWFVVSAIVLFVCALLLRGSLWMVSNDADVRRQLMSAVFCFYFIPLGLYGLMITFQTTSTVAGEREQDTLSFLLLIPDERRRILWMKWIGAFWRNWPIIAISILAAMFGGISSVVPWFSTIMLFVLPIPILLLLSGLSLYLSVLAPRTVIANTGLVVLGFVFVTAHVAMFNLLPGLFAYYASLIAGTQIREFTATDEVRSAISVAIDQSVLFFAGAFFVWAAFRRFVLRTP